MTSNRMQRTTQYQLCPSTSHSILILTIESPSLIKAFSGPEPLSSISTISGDVPCQALEPLNFVKSGLGFNLPGLCWLALKRAGSPYLLPRVSWTHGFKNMMTRPPPKKNGQNLIPKESTLLASDDHPIWCGLRTPHYPLVPICLSYGLLNSMQVIQPWYTPGSYGIIALVNTSCYPLTINMPRENTHQKWRV